VFTQVAAYDLAIAKYLTHAEWQESAGGELEARVELGDGFWRGASSGLVLERVQELRYGENPHQKASLYRQVGSDAQPWEQLGGKELSYNNLLDFDAALRLLRGIDSDLPCACIMKHLNPCGAAYGSSLLEALQRAKRGDPRSHFGGILAFNKEVNAEVAQAVREDFAEIIVATAFSAEALTVLRSSKNLRIIRVTPHTASVRRHELRIIEGGVLLQEIDQHLSDVREAQVMSRRAPTNAELSDLEFAWRVCAHVRSNAIVIAKDTTLIGVGAGQMSRIDSVELALSKARTHGHNLQGAVCASDAFFPFPDSVEALAAAGVKAVIAPKGAKRDAEAVAAADASGMALLFTDDRHFRH
jgi:phosphoribosylaminoimidazolecarboxamide formyltransferase/IMP cyclohydrolase